MLPVPNATNRREFLRDSLRYATLTGIAGLVAAAAARRGLTCTRQPVCDGCPRFAGCPESQAAATRKAIPSPGGES